MTLSLAGHRHHHPSSAAMRPARPPPLSWPEPWRTHVPNGPTSAPLPMRPAARSFILTSTATTTAAAINTPPPPPARTAPPPPPLPAPPASASYVTSSLLSPTIPPLPALEPLELDQPIVQDIQDRELPPLPQTPASQQDTDPDDLGIRRRPLTIDMAAANSRPVMVTTSMLSPIEPPPPYSPGRRRDPETASIISAAPSYNDSSPPAYEQIPSTTFSSRTTTITTTTPSSPRMRSPRSARAPPAVTRRPVPPSPQGLPRLEYAPGFVPLPRHHLALNNFVTRATARNPNRKHIENIANRRLESWGHAETLLSMGLRSPLEDAHADGASGNTPPASPYSEGSSSSSSSPSTSPTSPHLNPLEDPELVGHAAAEAHRRQREYLELLTTDSEQALALESRSWDFMLAQSIDWEERQHSWEVFQEQRRVGRGFRFADRWREMVRG